MILSYFISCTIEWTLRFANDEESEGKEVWCSDNTKSLRVCIERLGLYIVLLASHHNFYVRAPASILRFILRLTRTSESIKQTSSPLLHATIQDTEPCKKTRDFLVPL